MPAPPSRLEGATGMVPSRHLHPGGTMRPSFLAIVVTLAGLGLAACDARPASDGGGGTDPTSGAHTVHLTGTIAEPIVCSQCHNGQFQVTLQGPLASANGAQGSFNTTTLTCSGVYCHAGGPQLEIGGGTVPLPVWNPPTPIGCGGCHASPGAGAATPWHPAVAAGVQCALCHPGYSNTTVDKRYHVNGVANLTHPDLATNCAACHGDPTRVLPPGAPAVVKAAPPVDRNGSSSPTAAGVGAHQGHLLPGLAAIAAPVACSECHVVPTDLSHVGPTASTPAAVTWGALASANGASPSLVPPGPGSASFTCSNVYCHGGGPGLVIGGGTLTSPTWNPPSTVVCGSCHALPGGSIDTSSWHPSVVAGADCGLCHIGYTRALVNLAVHLNGEPNVRSPDLTTNCTACHGDPTRVVPPGEEILKVAPPVDRHGSSDTRQAGVGAHQAPLLPGATAISSPVACTECHVVPTNLLHVGPAFNTPASLEWGPLATAKGAAASFDSSSATCANYCHGATVTGGFTTQPVWTRVDGTQARCGTCHGSPPTSGRHELHASPRRLAISCGICHPTGYALGIVGPAVVPIHVDGEIEMNPIGFASWNPNAAGPGSLRGTATGCHGGARYWTGGAGGSCQ